MRIEGRKSADLGGEGERRSKMPGTGAGFRERVGAFDKRHLARKRREY